MKTLNEYINESLLDNLENLEKDSDNVIEKELIEKFLKKSYNITGQYTINNGIVDVNGSVNVTNKKLTELTNRMFVFGKIYNYFDCSICNQLKTLEGAPEEVGGNFICIHCTQLKTLKGAPKKVGGGFTCGNCNSLKSLEGAPKEVGGTFDCSCCTKLTSLKGAPKKVGGNFDCSLCDSLKSLEGAPKEVGYSFYCRNCGTPFTEEYVKSISKVKINNIRV
jgi:transcription elongation factor Elf1